jgi:hypothetical protein
MTSRRWFLPIAALGLGLAPGFARDARAQYGVSYGGLGNLGGTGGGGSSYGYGIRNGQVGSGYHAAGGLYGRAYRYSRPQTSVQFQPLMSAITSLPGWNGPTGGGHRRYRRHVVPPMTTYDESGRILWPSTIPDDPDSNRLKQAAEAAVRSVIHESKTTGHASVRPVIAAKSKLSAYERRILPDIKGRNVTGGDELEWFFFDIDRSLDTLTYYY